MLKIAFIYLFCLVLLTGCSTDDGVDPYNFEKDTPSWLKSRIDSISVDQQYYGTKIYRYNYTKMFVYHTLIPISSCAYCELYDHNGNRIRFDDDKQFQDFLSQRKNEVLIWEWEY